MGEKAPAGLVRAYRIRGAQGRDGGRNRTRAETGVLLEALHQRVNSPLTPLGQCQHIQRDHPAKPSKAKRLPRWSDADAPLELRSWPSRARCGAQGSGSTPRIARHRQVIGENDDRRVRAVSALERRASVGQPRGREEHPALIRRPGIASLRRCRVGSLESSKQPGNAGAAVLFGNDACD